MVEKSSVDVIASSADKVMEFTNGPITAFIPQPKAEVSTFSATGNTRQVATQEAILDSLERLSKEISKLAVGRSQSPIRQYKSRSPSPHHYRHSNNQDYAFITVALALKHGGVECPVRSRTSET